MAPERKGLILAHEGHRTALRHAGKRRRDATPPLQRCCGRRGRRRREATPLSLESLFGFLSRF